MKTCVITLRISWNAETEASPDGWDWDELLDTHTTPVEIVHYEEEG